MLRIKYIRMNFFMSGESFAKQTSCALHYPMKTVIEKHFLQSQIWRTINLQESYIHFIKDYIYSIDSIAPLISRESSAKQTPCTLHYPMKIVIETHFLQSQNWTILLSPMYDPDHNTFSLENHHTSFSFSSLSFSWQSVKIFMKSVPYHAISTAGIRVCA